MVRTGVLGAGVPGERHARALLRQGGRCVLAGVHDADPDAAAALAEATGAPAHADVAALLDAVDAVVVCGPVEQRPALARQAIQAGVDVLVEPPACTSAEGVRRVLSAVVRAPRRQVAQLAVADHHEPVLAALREVLGNERLVTVRTERTRPGAGKKGDLLDEVLLGDLHVVLALARGSEIITTQAAGRALHRFGPLEHAEALLLFADDLLATLVASHAGPVAERRVTVTTPTRRLTADLLAGTVDVLAAQGSHRLEVDPADPYDLQAAAFLRAVERRSPPGVGLGAALAGLEVAASIRRRIDLAAHRVPQRHVAAA